MAVAGVLEIQMRADVARLKTDMAKMQSTVSKGTKSASDSVGKLKTALGALGLSFGAIKMAGFIKDVIDGQEQLQKLSQKLNVSVEDLAGWSHAAALAGSDADVMRKGLTFLAKQLLDASSGLAESKRNFESLGIAIRNQDGEIKDLIPTMLEIADRFAESEDSTLKTALAFKVFGRAGIDLIPLLNQGSDAIQRQVDLGNLLNPVTAESAALSAQLIDTLLNLELSYKAVAIRAINDLLPVMVELTDILWEQRESALQAEHGMSPLVDVFKTLIILGSEFAFVFDTIGVAIFGVKHQLEGFITGGTSGFKKAREEMESVLAALRHDQDVFVERISSAGTTPTPRQEREIRPGRGLTPPPDISLKTKDPIQKANEAAQQYLLQLQKAEEFAIDSSESAKARWEIEHGNLQFADRLTQDLIKDKARERDQALAAIEAAKIIDELMEESALQQQDAMQETMRIGEQQKLRDIAARDSLIDRWQNEKETVEDQRNEELDLLQELWDKKLISENNFLEARLRMIEEFDKRRKHAEEISMTDSEKFTAMSWQNKTQTIFGELSALSAGVSTHSRKMFELNKIAGTAEAIINAYTGISRTLSAYPFPVNVAMAAAHGIAAFAQVSAIQSATFQGGGGGSAPSIAGSTPAPPVSPVGGDNAQSGGQTTIINFSGTTNERKMMKRFVNMLNENSRDGERITVS